jgi:hypothetical protein
MPGATKEDRDSTTLITFFLLGNQTSGSYSINSHCVNTFCNRRDVSMKVKGAFQNWHKDFLLRFPKQGSKESPQEFSLQTILRVEDGKELSTCYIF